MTNVSAGGAPVKGGSGDGDGAGDGAGGPGGGAMPSGRRALEISRLLVEVLQVGHVGRRGAIDAAEHSVAEAHFASAGGGGAGTGGGPGGTSAPGGGSAAGGGGAPGPVASHVIRAAIHVYEHGPQTITQLAAGIGISQGWASRIVDEMERAGYLERQRDPSDRRVVRVSLVPAAVERVERAYRWRGDAVEAALAGTTPEEGAVIEAFLRRFVEAARAEG